jgi:CRP-like cAMP-binding protein
LFAGLPLPDLASIANVTVVKSLAKGEYLFHEGGPAVGFYIVQRGSVNVHCVNAAGKEQVIHVFRAGDSFAEVVLALDKGYPAEARVLEPTQVLLVQKAGILALLRRQPELALRMLGSMSSHLRVLVGQLEDLTLKDVETRLANWLVKRCPHLQSEQPARIGVDHGQTGAGGGIGHGQRNLVADNGQIPGAETADRLGQNHCGLVAGEIERPVAAESRRMARDSF